MHVTMTNFVEKRGIKDILQWGQHTNHIRIHHVSSSIPWIGGVPGQLTSPQTNHPAEHMPRQLRSCPYLRRCRSDVRRPAVPSFLCSWTSECSVESIYPHHWNKMANMNGKDLEYSECRHFVLVCYNCVSYCFSKMSHQKNVITVKSFIFKGPNFRGFMKLCTFVGRNSVHMGLLV